MESFNLPCVSCQNQLLDSGSLLGTSFGPFVVCEVCRTLYYIDVMSNLNSKPLITIQPAKLDPDQEFDIIRNAESRVPLKEYLPEKNVGSDWGDYLPESEKEEKNINSHFKKDLKSIIDSSTTPSDLIRELNKSNE
jgi:hypothetical protein